METNDNTILEMQRQMEQLREMLNDQKIVNDRLLRNSCRNTVLKLKIKSTVPVIAAFAGLAVIPALRYLGFSYYFITFYGLLMLACIVATMISKKYIPSVDKDMVTAAKEISTFRRISADWIKYGIPCLVVFLGLLIWEAVKNLQLGGDELYGFIGGVAVGLVIGGAIGLKNRRDILNGSDELLAQIEELKETN